MDYIQPTSDGVILRVRVQPRSSKNGITGVADGYVKVCVNAPPAEGAANRACCQVLAKSLGISKARIEIASGVRSRQKRILLKGVEKELVASRIAKTLESSQ